FLAPQISLRPQVLRRLFGRFIRRPPSGLPHHHIPRGAVRSCLHSQFQYRHCVHPDTKFLWGESFLMQMRISAFHEPTLMARLGNNTGSVARYRKSLVGLPATMARAGRSRVTTLPAPTMAFSPLTTL